MMHHQVNHVNHGRSLSRPHQAIKAPARLSFIEIKSRTKQMPSGKLQIAAKTENMHSTVPQAFERLASLLTRQLLKPSRATGQQLIQVAPCGSIELHGNISNKYWESLLRDKSLNDQQALIRVFINRVARSSQAVQKLFLHH